MGGHGHVSTKNPAKIQRFGPHRMASKTQTKRQDSKTMRGSKGKRH